jgi:hypothetical protein
MNTLTIHRNTVGQFAQRNILTRFAYSLALLPFQILGAAIKALYWLLSHILPARRTALRVLFYQFIAVSLLMNIFQFHQHYVLRCEFNYKVQGWLMTKEQCGDLESSWRDAAELARQAELQAASVERGENFRVADQLSLP